MDQECHCFEGHVSCEPGQHRLFKQRFFDILYGFETVCVSCMDCYKVIEIEIKKLEH